jgi:hypothetical protein
MILFTLYILHESVEEAFMHCLFLIQHFYHPFLEILTSLYFHTIEETNVIIRFIIVFCSPKIMNFVLLGNKLHQNNSVYWYHYQQQKTVTLSCWSPNSEWSNNNSSPKEESDLPCSNTLHVITQFSFLVHCETVHWPLFPFKSKLTFFF